MTRERGFVSCSQLQPEHAPNGGLFNVVAVFTLRHDAPINTIIPGNLVQLISATSTHFAANHFARTDTSRPSLQLRPGRFPPHLTTHS
ncbi:hypothetical protein ETAA8_25890 [Anatilimnocola aggregata]|uniref:Uncharacterized protein n=1 Tax=Anatilimnocola aggregata TaxID=2528021 RepID=A0A517YBB3_9BACT|nr:hypothetical protein ETAA8_25890 [Anatilimnocola aggregata]